jgi:hypothetical protein
MTKNNIDRHQLKKSLCWSGLLVMALMMTSACRTLNVDRRSAADANYLEGLAQGRLKSGGATEYSPMADKVSFWDDDGTHTGPPSIKLVLSEQLAYFYKGGHLVGRSLIASGDEGHPTPTGNFKVIMKNANHRSSRYGDYIYPNGEIVKKNIDNQVDAKPPGTIYDGAKMTWYLNFYPALGCHAGYLPGYPASHGCVRLPEWMAKNFFMNASVGTPVTVVP